MQEQRVHDAMPYCVQAHHRRGSHSPAPPLVLATLHKVATVSSLAMHNNNPYTQKIHRKNTQRKLALTRPRACGVRCEQPEQQAARLQGHMVVAVRMCMRGAGE